VDGGLRVLRLAMVGTPPLGDEGPSSKIHFGKQLSRTILIFLAKKVFVGML
jgi:hypothetical protein